MTSKSEETFALQLRAIGLDAGCEREYRFHETRRWRFDFAWPFKRIAVEVEGVTHTGGRHQRPAGYTADAEKYNEAVMLGWRVLRGTQAMVKSGKLLEDVETLLQ